MEKKSKELLFEEIERLKEINLIDFVRYFKGFVIDEEKTLKENSNRNTPRYVYVHNRDGERLVITCRFSEGRQQYLYKNIDNDLDRGNILNFIKFRDPNYSIPYVKKKITNYEASIRRGRFIPCGTEIQLKESDLTSFGLDSEFSKMQTAYRNFPVLFDKKYLNSRGLDDEIITSPLCKDRIRNEIFHYTDHVTKKYFSYVNTIFPIYGYKSIDGGKKEGVLCGYVRRNDNLKQDGEGSAKSIGLWTTDFNKQSVVTAFAVSENPIDTLSYAQLHMDWKQTNPLLAATNGEPTHTQINLIQDLVNEYKPKELILLFDNAVSGQYFNAKLLSHIQLPTELYEEPEYVENNKLLVNADIHVARINSHEAQITWRISHDKKPDDMTNDQFLLNHIPAFQQIRGFYDKANKSLVGVNDEGYVFKCESVFKDNYSEVKATFANTIENWKKVNESIIALKFDQAPCIKIVIAEFKDFNEDLQVAKGLLKREQLEDKLPIDPVEPNNGIS